MSNKFPQSSLANAIRVLSMDGIQAANSGHPGAPMGMAEIAVALWTRHLKHNPVNPKWADRDRFVLSNGHGSMLIYSLLHLTGYDLPLEELKTFRQRLPTRIKRCDKRHRGANIHKAFAEQSAKFQQFFVERG